MRYSKKLLTLFFAAFLLIGSAAFTAQAQRRGARYVYRPTVIVRPYYGWANYYWHRGYWGNSYFGDPYFYDPYLNHQRQKYYLREELKGNQRELSKHLEKYRADGVITAKERKELDDDYRDVARAERKLKEFENGE